MSDVKRYKIDTIRLDNPTTARTHLVVHAELFDAAQSELAALREELARYKSLFDQAQKTIDRVNDLHRKKFAKLAERLTAAEQRNAELERLAEIAIPYLRKDGHPSLATMLEAALNPTESGASE